MKNVMLIDGERAVISYDPEVGMFRGEFVGLNAGADFYADSAAGLLDEGRQSLQVFLDVCRENGIEPRRSFSGRFNLRLPPELHAEAVLAAEAHGTSLNEWIEYTIKEALEAEPPHIKAS
ncbi:DNA repair protein [Xaviernesmea oryzae]|uniref:DNA repair protein n=1 Tax=Xaviernesmea oryzae TaxID=464029 RepID=A0A1Q9AZU2_9HYPH|nr:type II toxin-antitoxin system HicB family antitoxin [Xaviernesmea oryzae]OLP61240.1 DNA repair protein [Xaviernesmea oryzae]SEL51561.1 Predicted nuclease of the RNAse H fold, HicB family [Xaviernesmea oryzae]